MRNTFLKRKKRSWAFPRFAGSVSLRARLFGLVAGPPQSPAARVGRQFALAHPPVHLTRGRRNLFSQLFFLAPAFNVQLSTSQLSFSVPPSRGFFSHNQLYLGATHEGVCPKTPQAEGRGGSGPGGHLPRQTLFSHKDNLIMGYLKFWKLSEKPFEEVVQRTFFLRKRRPSRGP